MAVVTKTNRIDLRINNEKKDLLEKAASINNLSLSSYIISVCTRQAQLDLLNNEVVILNNKERDILIDLIDNPPEPNEKLRRLFK